MTMAEGGIISARYTLVIGDKNFSSWSLRPWIAMTHCGIPFAEECIRVRQPESKAAILRQSPSGKVPALKTNGLVVCDSLAVLEFLAERHPEHQLWPSDPEARAIARSISAEMHSGFVTLRNEMSMDSAQPLPCSSDRGRARSRHSPHRGDLARHARAIRWCRTIPVRRIHQCRRDVRAGRDALPHLWRGAFGLRR